MSRIAHQFAGKDPGAKPFLLAVEEHSLKNPGLPERDGMCERELDPGLSYFDNRELLSLPLPSRTFLEDNPGAEYLNPAHLTPVSYRYNMLRK